MEKNNGHFSDFSIQQAMKMAKSDAGKRLIALLQQTQGNQLQSAMDKASYGDMAGAKEIIRKIMANQEAQSLMQELQE